MGLPGIVRGRVGSPRWTPDAGYIVMKKARVKMVGTDLQPSIVTLLWIIDGDPTIEQVLS